jgi:Family of unknown function (DUF6510)
MQPRSHDEPLDGNAAGGLLSELFAFDVTAASVICDGCETTGDIAQARVYGGAMGAMFRCAHCDNIVIRLVRTPRGFWLDMRGTRSFFVRPPEA